MCISETMCKVDLFAPQGRRSYAEAAITGIKNAPPAEDQVVKGGRGELFFIQLDLGDLSIIKSSAEEIPRATT